MIHSQAKCILAATLVLSSTVWAKEVSWVDPLTDSAFLPVKKGCFTMGSRQLQQPSSSLAWLHYGYRGHLNADELPAHRVCVKGFWLGKHEVTAAAWERVLGERPPAGEGNEPVRGISLHDARRFLVRLNERSPNDRFRLPTEAEWEYACRAGGNDDAVSQYLVAAQKSLGARFATTGINGPLPVGQLKPNAWGFHDMLGNVWEWVADAYRADAYKSHALYDPTTPGREGDPAGLRGGSYRSEIAHIRCANRSHDLATAALPQYGLRLVREQARSTR
jgi:formylglycine-generating enzyme required for sulfatase activity